MGSHVLEVDTLLQEAQRLAHVFQALNPHLAFCGAGQPLSGENLKEFDEHLAIAEVGVEIGDLAVDPHKVRVHPLRERLLLHMLSLVWGTGRVRQDNKSMNEKGF